MTEQTIVARWELMGAPTMKTHFLMHPIRRRKSGWKRVLDALRDIVITARAARFSA